MNDIFVYSSALNPNDIIVSDPNILRAIKQVDSTAQQTTPFLTGGGQHIGKQKLVLREDFDDEELAIIGLIHFLTR